MTISKSRCTAYHEAAHAVIYLHFNIEVNEIKLYWDGNGICSVSDDLPTSEGRLLAILAGPAADKRLLGGDLETLRDRKNGWRIDLERANEVFRQLNRDGSIEGAMAESANLVKENWHTICSLAEELVKASGNFSEGDREYIMLGHEVATIVNRFRRAT